MVISSERTSKTTYKLAFKFVRLCPRSRCNTPTLLMNSAEATLPLAQVNSCMWLLEAAFNAAEDSHSWHATHISRVRAEEWAHWEDDIPSHAGGVNVNKMADALVARRRGNDRCAARRQHSHSLSGSESERTNLVCSLASSVLLDRIRDEHFRWLQLNSFSSKGYFTGSF